MLTEQEKQEILAEAAHYPYKRAASVEALKIVQRHHGFVSDEHLAQAAALLEMTPDELEAVATSYSLIYRRPVGRHVILLCDSVSCYICGYDHLREHLCRKLRIPDFGHTTADGRFTLLPVACLGACDAAPVMMIDQDLHGHVSEKKLDEVLKSYE